MSMPRLAALVGALLIGAACTSPASHTTAAPDLAANPPAAGAELASVSETDVSAGEDDPIVCRSVPRTGTRVSERICMRRSEIEKEKRAAHEMLGEVQRRGVQAGNQTPN